MARITESVCIKRDADTLWREIGDFGAVGDWHPMLAKAESEGNAVGATRTAHAKDGSTQVERLEVFDPERHLYRYTMESTSLPVRHYTGEFDIEENDDGSSTVIWKARFEVTGPDEDEAVGMVEGFLEAGLRSLEERYA